MRVNSKSLIVLSVTGVIGTGALAYGGTAVVTAAPNKRPNAHAQKLSRGEKLKKALKACKKEKAKRRKSCETSAHKKYGVKHQGTTTREPATSTPATTGATTTGTGLVGGTVTTGAGTGTGTTGTGATATGTTGTGTTGTGTTGTGTTATGTTGTGTTGMGTTGTTGGGGETEAEKQEKAKKAAELEKAHQAAITPSTALVMKGKPLFATNCASCHGPAGHGENTANPEETNLAQTCGCGNPIFPLALSVRGVMEELIEPREEPHQKQDFDQKLTIEEKEAIGAWVCVEVTQKFSNCG